MKLQDLQGPRNSDSRTSNDAWEPCTVRQEIIADSRYISGLHTPSMASVLAEIATIHLFK